jgi:arylformamidase
MKPVFRQYDAEGLERQYIPTHWPIVPPQTTSENWAKRAEEFHSRAKVVADVAYGTSKRQALDLLLPDKPHKAPVLAFIHGGYWRSPRLQKRNYSFCVEPLVAAGAIVAMVEHDLCPDVTMDQLTRQVQSACAWLWQNVADYGGDPHRLHVAGHSAGGHLTAMMATTDWVRFAPGLPPDMVKSIVPISGLFELEPLRLTSLNADLRLDFESTRRNSPILIAPTTQIPVSIVVGGGETEEYFRQSRAFADQWRQTTGPLSYFETAGHDHFTVIEAMTERHDPLTAILLKHLGL